MEEKTKKKRVQKRAVRKKAKATESVSVAAVPEVTTETKKPRKSSKVKSAANATKLNKRKLIVPLPTYEQVQLRAYFISERRRKLGLPGDESHDWLTAEQELRDELKV
ncbi:MAG: DUF2934 domain-containing protein [Verrucomicrobia bacterium]|nr:DUF2934 domain-containing protein [Verrucomicrobiota bacterium]MBV8485245.1 DUF2934 domain-containing protein [Verrucomicrobiota bacterium]